MTATHHHHCVIKDATWLQPLADPPGGRVLCREYYLKLMSDSLSGVFEYGRGRNLFIAGKPGSGKTICAKHILTEIRRRADEAQIQLKTVYVNAGKTRTPYYTLVDIVRSLGYDVPDCGYQVFRLKQTFERALEKSTLVICLDEVDNLLLKQREPLIYYLNRQPKTTLILISNRLRDTTKLPNRALSTLQPKLMILEPYTTEEAKHILKDRITRAFHPRTIIDRLLEEVAKVASEAEDIRLGFTILLTAGYLAEEQKQSEITAENIHAAIKSEATIGYLQRMDELEHQLKTCQRNC